MSDSKAKDSSDKSLQPTDLPLLKTPDATQVRNTGGESFRAIQDANPNRHSGSAGGDQELSLQIVADNDRVVIRGSKLTEKDLAAAPGKPKDGLSETGVELARLAKDNPILEPVAQLRKYADGLPPGEEKDMLINLSREQGAEQSPELRARLNGRVEHTTISEQGLYERIAKLPLDQQASVLSAGVAAYGSELGLQAFRLKVAEVTGIQQGVNGLAESAEGLGRSVYEAAIFSKEVIQRDPAATDKVEQAKESFGKLMVGTVRVFDVADSYLGSVGAASSEGDHKKAFRDICSLGQELNRQWDVLSPEEKVRLTSKIGTETLGGMAPGLGLAKLSKCKRLTDGLQDFGAACGEFGGSVRDKGADAIGRLINELKPKQMIQRSDGVLVPAPAAEVVVEKWKWTEGFKPEERAADDHISRMTPWFERGTKNALKGGINRAAEITGLPEEQIKRMLKEDPKALERMTNGQMIYMEKVYRETYLLAHPQYRNYKRPFEVHHRIPQDILKRFPGLFSHREIHDASNLVGIPRDTKVHGPIKTLWKDFIQNNEKPSRQDIIDFANKIDRENKRHYLP